MEFVILLTIIVGYLGVLLYWLDSLIPCYHVEALLSIDLVVICSETTCIMVEYLMMLFGSMCMVQLSSWLHNIVVLCSLLVYNILIF
jgi:hypothetical protein